MSTLLTLNEHEVFEAADGEAGLELAFRLRADAALVDIGLPRMDGYEFARRVRAQGASLWLVALTGYGHPEDRQHALEAGFEEHLVKPISVDELERIVKEGILARKRPATS
ncbi:response regulator [Pseudaquabacterium terrae]|uniref:response regulator n=1 Tax=Pseudaquabacterium terrae TaxID=2732868 RepID=UPI001FEC0C44|nr:response regulator [Aquabacterium terrae]